MNGGNTFTLAGNNTVWIHLDSYYSTLIDQVDLEKVLEHEWRAEELKRTDGSIKQVIAVGTGRDNKGRKKTIKLHRFLLEPSSNERVKHLDLDGLNNRRGNLYAYIPHY